MIFIVHVLFVIQNVGNLQKLPSDILENLPDQMPLKVPKFDKKTSSVEERKSSKLDIVKGKKPGKCNASY